MHTLTEDEMRRTPLAPLEDAARGEPTLITAEGQPVMLTVPLGANASTPLALLDLAAQLYDAGRVSLGRAAAIAGLGYSEMIDELGRRGIATIRLEPGELERELAAFES